MRAGELTAGGLLKQRIGERPFGAVAERDSLRFLEARTVKSPFGCVALPDVDQAHGLGSRQAEIAQ